MFDNGIGLSYRGVRFIKVLHGWAIEWIDCEQEPNRMNKKQQKYSINVMAVIIRRIQWFGGST